MVEEEAEGAVEKTESVPENTEVVETKKKGPRGQGRGRGGKGYIRGKMRGKALNHFGPIRRGMGRMRPYPDIRGRRGARGGPLYPPSLPMRGMIQISSSSPTTWANGLQGKISSPWSQRDATIASRTLFTPKRGNIVTL